ncbi:MAG: dehydratase [Bradyrhizobiaceae bacterium]|nr:dehydratase [Bradyrhizobiaceae bacterium]
MAEPLVLGRYFEDFVAGEALMSAGRTIGEGTIDLFAGLTGDFSDVHMDAEVMKETEFGGRIGHGILALGIMQGLMWQTNYNLGTAIATLGWDKVKSSAPLRAGDTVRAHWVIESKRESRSRPDMGILMEDCRLVNQRGETVLSGQHALMVRRRPA